MTRPRLTPVGSAAAVVALVALAVGWVEPAAADPAGTFDPTFADGGVLLDPTIGGAGSLVVSGTRTYVAAAPQPGDESSMHHVVALADDGSLDPTFGTGGVADVDAAGAFGVDLEVAPAGGVYAIRSRFDEVLVTRLDAAGAPDLSYGTAGTVTLPITLGNNTLMQWQSHTVDAAGALTLAGMVSATGTRNLAVVRLDPDGRPDAGFGTGGLSIVPLDVGQLERTADVVLDASGRSVVLIENIDSGAPSYLLRFSTTGTLDRSFGTNGLAVATRGIHAFRLAADAAGRVLVFGQRVIVDGPNRDVVPVLARLGAGGLPDPGFAGDGLFALPRVPGVSLFAGDLVVDHAGRIVLSFAAFTTTNVLTGLIRLQPDGLADPSFGYGSGAGVAAWPATGPIRAVGVDAQDRVLAGSTLVSPTDPCAPQCGDLLVHRLRAA